MGLEHLDGSSRKFRVRTRMPAQRGGENCGGRAHANAEKSGITCDRSPANQVGNFEQSPSENERNREMDRHRMESPE
jgi:hypothetical protein